MRGVTVEDLLSYRFVSSLRLCPEGKRVAFLVKSARGGGDEYDTDIFVCELATGMTKQLTASGKEGPFVWSEDGASILFVSKRDGDDSKSTVYGLPVDGGEARPMTSIDHKVESLERSDGGSLLFTARVPRAAGDAEDDVEVLEEIPFWQNGKGFTSRRRLHLFSLNPTSGECVELLGGALEVGPFDVLGDRVAVLARRFEGVAPITWELWAVDLATSSTSCLSRGELQLDAVRFLSGSQVVVLGTTGDRYGLGQSRELICFDLPDGSWSSLTPDWNRMPGNRVVADCRGGAGEALRCHDGHSYVVVTEGGESFVEKVGIDGRSERVAGGPGSVDDFAVGARGVVFTGLREGRLQELYLASSGAETQLTTLNAQALEGRELAVPEAFPVTRPNGVQLDAWLLRPIDCEEGRRYPAILEIHGGPKAAYGTVFMHEFQALANAGYAVIYANPRGSAGRGDAFADLRGRYGTIDYEDLMAVVDEALRRYPCLDPNRLGVTGGSYGGYMTNWIIGHSARFRAAVSQRSIANWISKTCTTDIGYYFNVDQLGTTPWAADGAQTMWWHSPLRYAEHVTTPTLFIHSEEDYRCWLDQGLQMFTALRYHGVETRLALFRGENHELSRSGKPRHRVRRLTEMLAWLDRHLRDGR